MPAFAVKQPGGGDNEKRFDKFRWLERKAEDHQPAGGALVGFAPKKKVQTTRAMAAQVADQRKPADEFELLHGKGDHDHIGQRRKEQMAFDEVIAVKADPRCHRGAGGKSQQDAEDD